MSLSTVDARPRAALPAPRQALYPTFSAAWAATSGFVLAGGPSSRVVGCYEGPRTPCFGRIRGLNPYRIVRVLASVIDGFLQNTVRREQHSLNYAAIFEADKCSVNLAEDFCSLHRARRV